MNPKIRRLRGLARAEEALDEAIAHLQAEAQRFRQGAERFDGAAREHLLGHSDAAADGLRALQAVFSAIEAEANALAQDPEVARWLEECGQDGEGLPGRDDPWAGFAWHRNSGQAMTRERID